jgi:hypothetical protein
MKLKKALILFFIFCILAPAAMGAKLKEDAGSSSNDKNGEEESNQYTENEISDKVKTVSNTEPMLLAESKDLKTGNLKNDGEVYKKIVDYDPNSKLSDMTLHMCSRESEYMSSADSETQAIALKGYERALEDLAEAILPANYPWSIGQINDGEEGWLPPALIIPTKGDKDALTITIDASLDGEEWVFGWKVDDQPLDLLVPPQIYAMKK